MSTPSPAGRNRPVCSLLGTGLAALMLVLSSPGVSHADSGDESRIPPAVAALADALPARDASPEDVAKVARAIGWELTRTQPGATVPLMRAGSRCEGAELVDGVLIVRFSVPPGTVLDEDDVETAHMVFTRFVAGPLELSETRIEVREMPGPGAIRSTTDFAPMHTFAPEPPPVPEPVVNEDEPPGFPGPDYKTLYAELRRAADEARTRAITGQSPVATGAQPTGALTGRTIYFSAGHGIALITAGTWDFGRAFIQGMNEDLGNVDQTNFFAEAVFNAGGTVVCMRPIGQQTNEVVLDNTSSDVTWTPSIGSWTLSGSSTDNFGDSTGNNMRSINSAATETATATYTPNIPQAGFYPVYCFANASSNRCSGQLYRVKHSAGETQVRVNHRRVGRGWVWLGTYYFSAGKNAETGSVVISNLNPPAGTSGLVIADAIRFGNGMGSISRNGRLSGQEREAEGNRYWAQISEAPSSVWDSVGATTSDPNNFNDTSDNVSSPARMAAYMWNNDGQGYNGDIYLGFHTNATGNGARGSIGLITSAATVVNQPRWATLVSDVLDAMCLIEDDNWESTWFNRSSATYTSSYGEIGAALGGRMCGTIVEVAFHDDPIDSKLLRDPKVRYVAARSQVHAAIKYFNEFDSNPVAYPPVPPQRVRATNVAGGIRVAWAPVAASPAGPQAATGYRVYTSPDGLNYRLATELAGYTNTQTTLAGIPSGDVLYVRVSATNAGGESSPSETLAARSTAGATPPVLVVSGYDRIDRFNNVPRFPSNPEASSGERLFVRRNNSYDYARMAAASITAAGRWFDMADNESVIAGDVSLGTYATVVWMTGEEAEKDRTLDSTERTRLQTFLGLANKSLFISGANIANELDTQNVARSFYNTWLRADDTGRTTRNYVAEGVAGSALAGVSVAFPPGPDMYDVAAADVLAPLGGATVAMNYGGVGGGTTVLEAFEAQGGWWDPNNSGTTNADASSTFEMTTTRVREGARSGEIYYAWGSGNTLRVYNSSQSPVPSNATISLWVYGDNSGNSFSILVRDTADTELFENTPITLNFTGWQQITWDLQSDPRTRFFGTGDNAITNPTVAFDSLLVRKVGAAATGTIHVDDATYSTAGGASPSPAAVQYSGAYRLVNFGFPFEAISGDSERTQVMQKVLDYLGAPPAAAVADWHLY